MMKFAFFAFSESDQPDRAELNGSFPEKPEPEVNSASSSDSEDTEGPEEGFDNDDDANVSKVSWQLLVIIETNLPLSATTGMTIVKLLVMPVIIFLKVPRSGGEPGIF